MNEEDRVAFTEQLLTQATIIKNKFIDPTTTASLLFEEAQKQKKSVTKLITDAQDKGQKEH